MASMPGFACQESENFPAAPENLSEKRINIGKFPESDRQTARSPAVSVSRTVPVQSIARTVRNERLVFNSPKTNDFESVHSYPSLIRYWPESSCLTIPSSVKASKTCVTDFSGLRL